MKQPVVIANWKMNPASLKEAIRLFAVTDKAAFGRDVQVVVCPPAVYLSELSGKKQCAFLGAQDCSLLDKGALTGDVSATQLKSMGCSHVIVGHSERAKYYKETADTAVLKAKAAVKAKLKVVLCAKDENELKLYKKKLKNFRNVLIVWEPPSAISTEGGKAVKPAAIARKASSFRKIAGRGVSVLYGGSVDEKNVGAVLSEGFMDGILVGGSSLKAPQFTRLVKEAALV